MKTKITVLLLTLYALQIYSCTSNNQKNAEKKSHSENTITTDTSMKNVTGITEKTPPVENGNYIAKYPGGIVKMKGFYMNGKRTGQWTSFFENGKIQSEGFFKNGLRDGKAIVYFENGKIYYTGFYKDGREVGKWLFFDMAGDTINEKNYGDMPNP